MLSSAPSNSATETQAAGRSYGAADLGHFVETAADPDAIAKTDGWSGYAAVPADRASTRGKRTMRIHARGAHDATLSEDGRRLLRYMPLYRGYIFRLYLAISAAISASLYAEPLYPTAC